MVVKNYSELVKIKTFEGRIKYLQTFSFVGESTFGGHRYLNQILYRSPEWRRFRREVILRDHGCDLGLLDREIIFDSPLIHHINAITIEDIQRRDPKIFDFENVITTTPSTHRIIHYQHEEIREYKPRVPNDTCVWR